MISQCSIFFISHKFYCKPEIILHNFAESRHTQQVENHFLQFHIS